jgi:hypothetical protein
MSDINAFLERLTTGGLEDFRKFYSWYRGIVTSNSDPETRGRIQVAIHSVGQRQSNGVWIDPAMDYAGPNHGSFWPPEVGDPVWVGFWTGDTAQPHIYMGGWYGDGSGPIGKLPSKLGYSGGSVPVQRGWVTKAQHSLVFDDQSGSESIQIVWKGTSTTLLFDKNGNITVQNQTGAKATLLNDVITLSTTANATVTLDSAKITMTDGAQNVVSMDGVATVQLTQNGGNQMTLSPAGVSISSAGPTMIQSVGPITLSGPQVLLGPAPSSPTMRFEEFLAMFAAHVHPTAVGPSLPPIASAPLLPTIASIPVIVS